MQDDGTFGEDGEGSPLAASPGSVSLGEDSSDEDDEEDGDAAEHRVNVRTGQLDHQALMVSTPHVVRSCIHQSLFVSKFHLSSCLYMCARSVPLRHEEAAESHRLHLVALHAYWTAFLPPAWHCQTGMLI